MGGGARADAPRIGRSGVRRLDRAVDPGILRQGRAEDRRRQAFRAQLGGQPLCRAHRARLPRRGRRAGFDRHRDGRAAPASAATCPREPRARPSARQRLLSAAARRSRASEDSAKGLWTRMLHPQQTFDSFIPGPANEFGHGAARELRRRPAERHSPALHPWRLRLSARPIC